MLLCDTIDIIWYGSLFVNSFLKNIYIHLIIGNLNAGIIKFQLDFFNNAPAGSPVILRSSPAAGAQDHRTVGQLVDVYRDGLILQDLGILPVNTLQDSLGFFQIGGIADTNGQVRSIRRFSCAVTLVITAFDRVPLGMVIRRLSTVRRVVYTRPIFKTFPSTPSDTI